MPASISNACRCAEAGQAVVDFGTIYDLRYE